MRPGRPLLTEKSIKKALDRDWSDAKQKGEAVDVLAKQASSLEQWVSRHIDEEIDKPKLGELVGTLHQLMVQDLEADPGDAERVRVAHGVAEDRRISVEGGDMRHARKSKSNP